MANLWLCLPSICPLAHAHHRISSCITNSRARPCLHHSTPQCTEGGANIRVLTREESQRTQRQLAAPADLRDGSYMISMEQQMPGPCEVTVVIEEVEMQKVVVEFTDPKKVAMAMVAEVADDSEEDEWRSPREEEKKPVSKKREQAARLTPAAARGAPAPARTPGDSARQGSVSFRNKGAAPSPAPSPAKSPARRKRSASRDSASSQ